MSEKDIFPKITIRAAYGDEVKFYEINFNRYAGGTGYQVMLASDNPGQYFYKGEVWYGHGQWRASNAEFTLDDIQAIGERIEAEYGIEKARDPRAFID